VGRVDLRDVLLPLFALDRFAHCLTVPCKLDLL
jgi:hypothetical protein